MSSNSLTVHLRTLTPLWTGGIDGTMDRLHETGLLGSLRWWYEAIVRGLGGSACDPTTHEHELSGQRLRRYEKVRQKGKDWWTALGDAGICDACKVFGTTGWQRRFRLEVVEDNIQPLWEPKDKMLNIRPPGRTRGWYLPPGWMGTFTLKFSGDPKVLSLTAALLLFMEKWGNLGAKPQLGYGVFKIENRKEVIGWTQENKEGPGWEWSILGNSPSTSKLPDLRRFGFFKYRFSPDKPGWWTQVPGLSRIGPQVQPLVSRYGIVPVSPALKNEWRYNRWNRRWGDDREIFGTLRPDRVSSKVAVSWAYQHKNGEWEIRGWAWLASERWKERMWNMVKNSSIWEQIVGTTGGLEAILLIGGENSKNFITVIK